MGYTAGCRTKESGSESGSSKKEKSSCGGGQCSVCATESGSESPASGQKKCS